MLLEAGKAGAFRGDHQAARTRQTGSKTKVVTSGGGRFLQNCVHVWSGEGQTHWRVQVSGPHSVIEVVM